MLRPLLIFSQSDYFIHVVDTNSHTKWQNSTDPDQFASLETNWSESTLFAKARYIRVQKTRIKYSVGISTLTILLQTSSSVI